MFILELLRPFFIFCVSFVLFAVNSVVLGEIVEPNDLNGTCYSTFGTMQTPDSCPSWVEVINREGVDGGQLTVEVDGCQVGNYEVFTMEQYSGGGYLADLELDDIFIEWDEDTGDGSLGQFIFSGTYVEVTEALPDYIQVSSSHNNTNWTVFRVTESGTLIITDTEKNEDEAIHFSNRLYFTKTDDIGTDPNFTICVSPVDEFADEFTYTICWDNTSNETFFNVKLIDYLPVGVDYKSADPTGYSANHTTTVGTRGIITITV